MHENYDQSIQAYDIGLVHVKGPITFNERVQPVPLSPGEVPAKSLLMVSGRFELKFLAIIQTTNGPFFRLGSIGEI